ncbi:unnamed protein product, partial [Chrysoparadoxa australica]
RFLNPRASLSVPAPVTKRMVQISLFLAAAFGYLVAAAADPSCDERLRLTEDGELNNACVCTQPIEFNAAGETFSSREEAGDALVAHCGACGTCSNYQDFAVMASFPVDTAGADERLQVYPGLYQTLKGSQAAWKRSKEKGLEQLSDDEGPEHDQLGLGLLAFACSLNGRDAIHKGATEEEAASVVVMCMENFLQNMVGQSFTGDCMDTWAARSVCGLQKCGEDTNNDCTCAQQVTDLAMAAQAYEMGMIDESMFNSLLQEFMESSECAARGLIDPSTGDV